MSDPMDTVVLKMQRDSLRDALRKVLDADDAEKRACIGYEDAKEHGLSLVEPKKKYVAASFAARDAAREARVLLLTLRNGA